MSDPHKKVEEFLAGLSAKQIAELEKAAKPWQPYEPWLTTNFPNTFNEPLAACHHEFWQQVSSVRLGQYQPAFVQALGRGMGKTSQAEHAVALVATRQVRKFGLYISAIQTQANLHIQNIASILTGMDLKREVDEQGRDTGWRRDHLRLFNFAIGGFGIDGAMRGIKVGSQRVDFFFFDDIDEQDDSPERVQQKIDAITQKILPAGSPDAVVFFLQNVIHENSIMSRLLDGRADFLTDRIVSGPIKAVENCVIEDKEDPVTGRKFWKLSGQSNFLDLKVWDRKVNEWGKKAFLREAQHEVERTGGYFFDSRMFGFVDEAPEGLPVCMAWDMAATEDGGDYTVGVKMAMDEVGTTYVLDVVRGQWSSEKVRARVLTEASEVRRRFKQYVIRLSQDPSQAGKDQANRYAALMQSFNLRIQSVTGTKAKRADGWAEAVNLGKVKLVRADWNYEFIEEHKWFMEFGYKGHDDQIDSAADSHGQLASSLTGAEVLDRWASPEISDGAVSAGTGDVDPEFDSGPPSIQEIMRMSREINDEGDYGQAVGW